MKYAELDKNGFIIGIYDDLIHKNIPNNSVKINNDIYKKIIKCEVNYYDIINKEFTFKSYISIKEQVNFIKNKIKQFFTNKVKQLLKDNDYDNEGEVALYASNTKSIWKDEAKAIQKQIEEIYKFMYKVLEQVNEQNYKQFTDDYLQSIYEKGEING